MTVKREIKRNRLRETDKEKQIRETDKRDR
jgi:hypothetical protein